MLKQCLICGKEFTTIPKGGSRKYCFICSPSYVKGDNISRGMTITNIRKALKKALVEKKGGVCQKCGYNKSLSALEFHHLDPNLKDFSIGDYTSGQNVNIAKAFIEVEKCILLCANCHREIHENN